MKLTGLPMIELNICIISQEFPPYTNWGGIAVYNSELSAAFSRLGHKVTVVSRAEKGAPDRETLASGVEVWRVGKPLRRKYLVGRTVDRILHAGDVFRKVRELDAVRRFDVIETTEAGLEGEQLLREPDYRSRMVIQCNGSNAMGVVPQGMLAGLHRLDWQWSLRREVVTLHQVPRILVTTDATRQFLLQQGIAGQKIGLIYQGIDVKRFAPPEVPVSDIPLQVGFAGRLENRKGIDLIWKVIERIGPDAGIHFHFKGAIHPSTGDEVAAQLRRHASFVTYHGAGAPASMPAYYRSLHVLLQPSRFENFGLVYAEGMASGLVVFAGRQGGGSEIVRHGVTGYLVDPDAGAAHVEEVAERLRAIAADPSAFSEMRRKAREDVIERFSLESCARSKVAFYRQSQVETGGAA
jgi:glycosyltransferase involved in cell wall biosynthesis